MGPLQPNDGDNSSPSNYHTPMSISLSRVAATGRPGTPGGRPEGKVARSEQRHLKLLGVASAKREGSQPGKRTAIPPPRGLTLNPRAPGCGAQHLGRGAERAPQRPASTAAIPGTPGGAAVSAGDARPDAAAGATGPREPAWGRRPRRGWVTARGGRAGRPRGRGGQLGPPAGAAAGPAWGVGRGGPALTCLQLAELASRRSHRSRRSACRRLGSPRQPPAKWRRGGAGRGRERRSRPPRAPAPPRPTPGSARAPRGT